MAARGRWPGAGKFPGQQEHFLIYPSTVELIVLLGLLFNTIWNRGKCIDDLSLQKANISLTILKVHCVKVEVTVSKLRRTDNCDKSVNTTICPSRDTEIALINRPSVAGAVLQIRFAQVEYPL